MYTMSDQIVNYYPQAVECGTANEELRRTFAPPVLGL
jgi:hypothetical protein